VRGFRHSSKVLKASDVLADHSVEGKNSLIVEVDLIMFGRERLLISKGRILYFKEVEAGDFRR
jgi:hypothetical protein